MRTCQIATYMASYIGIYINENAIYQQEKFSDYHHIISKGVYSYLASTT